MKGPSLGPCGRSTPSAGVLVSSQELEAVTSRHMTHPRVIVSARDRRASHRSCDLSGGVVAVRRAAEPRAWGCSEVRPSVTHIYFTLEALSVSEIPSAQCAGAVQIHESGALCFWCMCMFLHQKQTSASSFVLCLYVNLVTWPRSGPLRYFNFPLWIAACAVSLRRRAAATRVRQRGVLAGWPRDVTSRHPSFRN